MSRRAPEPSRERALQAGVELRLDDGARAFATHGDIVGRLATSAVHVDDPAVSEAHALVSLRAGAFRLMALRGALGVDGALVNEVLLTPGRSIQLTPKNTITVVHLQLPSAVLAIEGEGLPRQALPPSCSLEVGPTPRLWPRFRPDAAAWIWSNGAEWTLRVDGATRPLRDGEAFSVAGQSFRTVLMPLAASEGAATVGPALDLEPLVIEARFDVVLIRRGAAPPITLVGRSARLVAELVALGGSAEWLVLAREIWGEDDRDALRKKLDVCILRLRKKLQSARLRPNLVRPLGNGVIALVLHPSDRVIDAS